MTETVIDILQRYIEQSKAKESIPGKVSTVAEEAKMLGVSAGTLSQLRNGKPITHKVIEKIAEKLADNNEVRRNRIRHELRATRDLPKTETTKMDALDKFRGFQQTSSDAKRLLCCSYRDVPQSTDTGTYPGYIDTSASIIIGGLSWAFFQPFGPVDEIKEKLKNALDRNDKEASAVWKYIDTIATGVQEVFGKTKASVDAGDVSESGNQKGQVVLYEASRVSPLSACDVNSRVFYSSEQIAERHVSRVVQLIRCQDKEEFIECTMEPAYQAAVAAQFYPVLEYWRSNGRLPIKEVELKPYYGNNEKCPWKIWREPMV